MQTQQKAFVFLFNNVFFFFFNIDANEINFFHQQINYSKVL